MNLIFIIKSFNRLPKLILIVFFLSLSFFSRSFQVSGNFVWENSLKLCHNSIKCDKYKSILWQIIIPFSHLELARYIELSNQISQVHNMAWIHLELYNNTSLYATQWWVLSVLCAAYVFPRYGYGFIKYTVVACEMSKCNRVGAARSLARKKKGEWRTYSNTATQYSTHKSNLNSSWSYHNLSKLQTLSGV